MSLAPWEGYEGGSRSRIPRSPISKNSETLSLVCVACAVMDMRRVSGQENEWYACCRARSKTRESSRATFACREASKKVVRGSEGHQETQNTRTPESRDLKKGKEILQA